MGKVNLVKVALLLLFLGGALFFAFFQRGAQATRPGDEAPDFTLPLVGGGSVSLHDFRQQVVVLNFWATWCPPCVEEIPSLQKFAAQVQGSGVMVVGVSTDRNQQTLRQFVAEHHLNYPVASDADQSVSARYGTFRYPESYLIGRDGRIARKIVGAVDWQDPELLAAVQALAGAK